MHTNGAPLGDCTAADWEPHQSPEGLIAACYSIAEPR